MATVTYVLKNPQADTPTPLFLILRHKAGRFKYSIGEKIHPRHWNTSTSEARKNAPGGSDLNRTLVAIAEAAMEVYRKCIRENTPPTNELLKEDLDKLLHPEPEPAPKTTFWDVFKTFEEVKASSVKEGTLKVYGTLRNHLKAFEQAKGYRLTFETINLTFGERFISYLIKEADVYNNTIAKHIRTLKTFMNWALERGYHLNTSFRKLTAKERDADIIYLTEEELLHLHNFDLSGNQRLAQVRDTFCFACFTGLRYSDIARLSKAKIKGDWIHFVTQKTGDKLDVYLIPSAMEILERNGNQLPVISNQKFNTYLKELGQLAGIDEPTTITRYKGVEEIVEVGPKYQFLSFHDARRTFVTLSLEKGMRHEILMSFTGHKHYKTLKKYIKLTDSVKATEMRAAWIRKQETPHQAATG